MGRTLGALWGTSTASPQGARRCLKGSPAGFPLPQVGSHLFGVVKVLKDVAHRKSYILQQCTNHSNCDRASLWRINHIIPWISDMHAPWV